MDNVFTFMLTTIDGYLENFVDNGVAAMIGPLGTVFTAAGGLYFALMGWAIMFGYSQTSMVDLMRQVFKFFLVYTFATFGLIYGVIVTDFFWNVPEGLANVMLGVAGASATGDVASASDVAGIELVIEQYSERVNIVTKKIAESGRVVPDVIAAFLALAMFIPLIAASFIVLISKVGLSIMLVLGPLMILSSLFGWTKGLFEGWLRQSLTFVFTAILAYAVIALLVSILDAFADELIAAAGSGNIAWTQGIPIALLAIVAAIVFLQIPQFAAGLVGGIGIGDLGVTQMAARGGARRASAGARSAGARAGRAINRSGSAAAASIAPKLPPKMLSAAAGARAAMGAGAQRASYYSGAKNASPPASRPTPPTAKPAPKPAAPVNK